MFNDQQKQYLLRIQRAAKIGQSKTGIPAELIAAWWTWETAYGTNKTHLVENHAGIKSNSSGKDFVSGQYAGYKSIDNFANDWARIINLNMAGYPAIIQAARAKKSYAEITDVHNKSGWSEADYNINTIAKRAENIRVLYGSNLAPSSPPSPTNTDNLSQDDLKKYAAIGLAVLAAIALVKN